jgi:hypothetical protein
VSLDQLLRLLVMLLAFGAYAAGAAAVQPSADDGISISVYQTDDGGDDEGEDDGEDETDEPMSDDADSDDDGDTESEEGEDE